MNSFFVREDYLGTLTNCANSLQLKMKRNKEGLHVTKRNGKK